MNLKPFYIFGIPKLKHKQTVFNVVLNCRTFKNIVPSTPVNTISLSEVKNKLKSNNIVYLDGFTCLAVNECSLCYPLVKRVTAARTTDIFINKTTGHFLCENCKSAGSWDAFSRLLGERAKVERSAKDVAALKDGCVRYDKASDKWKEVLLTCSPLYTMPENEVEKILFMFDLQYCVSSVLEKLQVYINEERSVLYMPLTTHSQLVVGYKSFDKSGASCTVPRNDSAGCVVNFTKKKQAAVIIVSNIRDLFTLVSLNLNYHVVCLPFGVASLPQNVLPMLEGFNKIILWLGCAVGAWDSAKNFAKKLNDKRCFVIRPSDSQYSPTIARAKGENIERIIADAQPTWHQAITTFGSLRNDVLTELQNHEQVLGIKWKRYPSLNKILKGHRRGELTILTGPTGSGKTTFMSEYSLDLAMQGVNTLWGSFEIRNVRLVRTMLQQFAGLPLEDNLSEFDVHADQFEKLPIYFMTFHGQQSIKAVMEAVEYSSYIYDIAHVIIDNVQFMIGVSDESKFTDKFWKQDVVIQSFRNFASKNNCHVTLVIHPRKEKDTEDLTTNSIFGGAKAAQEADNILIIQDKRLTSLKGKKYLQVSKNRYTGDLGVMLLDYDKASLSYMPKKKQPLIKPATEERED